MRKEFKETIGSNTYTFKQLRLSPARELMETLGKIGETVSSPMSKPGVTTEDIAPGIMGEVVAALVRSFGSSDGKKALDLLMFESKVLLKGVQAEMKLGDVAEDHFGEFFGELVPFVSFALKNQFGPFVPSLAAVIPNAAKLKAMQGMSAFLGASAGSTTSDKGS